MVTAGTLELTYDGALSFNFNSRTSMRPKVRPLSFAVVVAMTLVIAAAAVPVRDAYRAFRVRTAMANLIAMAGKEPEPQSRWSVMASRPRVTEMRSPVPSGGSMQIMGAANEVLQRTNGQDSPEARHAAATARYLAREYPEAARELESLAQRTGRAEHWSDLAAARLEAAVQTNKLQDLVPALVAADRALSIEPTLATALFNRAAILQRMGVRPVASKALKVGLAAEADPAWQQRIRELQKEVGALTDTQQWNERMPKPEAAATAKALPALAGVAHRFRQHARLWGEGALPVEWAKAMSTGDTATADTNLRLARDLATAVQQLSGESLAAESIAVIDEARATRNVNRTKLLVEGYSRYGEGRQLYKRDSFAEAEKKLREAKRAFEAAGSPMVLMARLYIANAVSEQHRLAEATPELAALEQEAASAGKRYQALAADVAYQISRVEGVRGHWATALAAAAKSIRGFQDLGEKGNAAMAENMLAELFDSLGQPERAWGHRVSAFDAVSDYGDYNRLRVALMAPSSALLRQRDWPAAISLLNVEVEVSRLHNGLYVADTMARRARALAENGDAAAARRDLVSAREEVETVGDGSHDFVVANIDAAEGVIERKRDPQRSTRLLTNAINFYESSNRRINLPEPLLERGRSRLAAGDEPGALADFEAGIDELERQRAAVSDYDYRATFADVGEELYAEAVRIAVRRGDPEKAFEYSERAHAQALLLQIAGEPKREREIPPPGTLVIEYMVLPEQLVIFAKDTELRMEVVPIEQAALENLVDAFTSAIVKDSAEQVRSAGSALDEVLLQRVRAEIERAKGVVFVPSRFLEKVPWAALYQESKKRYLTEHVAVSTAPSLAVLALKTNNDDRPPSTAVVTGNPRPHGSPFVNLPTLPAAESEAAAIASIYPNSTLLLGGEATTQRFLREAAKADVVHFAGHALSSESTAEKSFLVLARDAATGDSGFLYSRDIAQLPSLRNVRLVVLAACGTMRGNSVHLDGMPSIARSFLAAGVPAVIGTLWDIEDQRSSKLFEDIHRLVADGVSPAEAVRKVQRDSIRSADPELAHPRTWSGLTVIGGVSAARTATDRD